MHGRTAVLADEHAGSTEGYGRRSRLVSLAITDIEARILIVKELYHRLQKEVLHRGREPVVVDEDSSNVGPLY